MDLLFRSVLAEGRWVTLKVWSPSEAPGWNPHAVPTLGPPNLLFLFWTLGPDAVSSPPRVGSGARHDRRAPTRGLGAVSRGALSWPGGRDVPLPPLLASAVTWLPGQGHFLFRAHCLGEAEAPLHESAIRRLFPKCDSSPAVQSDSALS